MLVIAHRGASGNAPENTMAAFKKAVALGANFIETDLQLSRDARLVAIHDATVNRTTNGQGTVHDMTLTELRRLVAEDRRKDLQVVCWTVNHPAHMRLLAAAGVDGIMSDYPDRLVAAVRKEAESIP